jgi:hypothetical protein
MSYGAPGHKELDDRQLQLQLGLEWLGCYIAVTALTTNLGYLSFPEHLPLFEAQLPMRVTIISDSCC